MQGSASGSNVRYYPTWKHSPLKERNEQGCHNAWTARCLQLGCDHHVSLLLTTRMPSVHLHALYSLPHWNKYVYTQQGSTRDLWTVRTSETSVYLYEATRCRIPEDCHFQCSTNLSLINYTAARRYKQIGRESVFKESPLFASVTLPLPVNWLNPWGLPRVIAFKFYK
jgi:hypothetical protein